MKLDLSQGEREFIERMGFWGQEDGFNRLANKIWALIMLRGEAISFSTLAETLEVSRGSISSGTRTLIALGVLERRTVSGERQDHFVMKRNPYIAFLQANAMRNQQRAEAIEEMTAAIESSDAQVNLHELREFYALNAEISSQALRSITSPDARSSSKK